MHPTQTQLEAALTQAVFAPITNTGWVRVTGEDRVRWLNGMVTNSITALAPGEGCYNFFLNAQGRIQGDCTAWLQPDAILLETAADRAEALIAYLDHFIIMDDVELTLLPPASGLLLTGPRSPELLLALELPIPDPLHRLSTPWQSAPLDLLRAQRRFELWSDPATVGLLAKSLRHAGATEASPDTLTHLRLLEATPLYGTDIRDKELPQETSQTHALHFAKGCYLGQEIVERIRSRGQVNRLFQPFTLHGEIPPAGTILTANDKPAGELTSIAEVPGYGILALGYIRREALSSSGNDTHAPLAYPGGTARVRTQDPKLTTQNP